MPCSWILGKFDKIVRNIVVRILQHQLVYSDTGSAHLVLQGSGMGMILSGNVSDLTFCDLAEKDLLVILTDGITYLRYTDDLLVVDDVEQRHETLKLAV